jgi:hypothetical protein
MRCILWYTVSDCPSACEIRSSLSLQTSTGCRSAGPMSWGPLVGGTGVRELHSLPSVDFSFGDLPPMPSHGAKLADALNAIMEKGVVEDDAVRASSPPSWTHRALVSIASQTPPTAVAQCTTVSVCHCTITAPAFQHT